MILKTKKNKMSGGSNKIENNNSNSKTKKLKNAVKTGYYKVKNTVVNVKDNVNRCKFDALLIGEFKCKSDTELFEDTCNKKYIMKTLKNHKMFKNEPDKIYIQKYFEPALNDYINKNSTKKTIKQKLINVASILECLNYDMSNIFMTFYKISTFNFDPESENYKIWKGKKSFDEKNKNKSDKQILVEKFADFIIDVIVKSFINYKNKELKIKKDFYNFLIKIDTTLANKFYNLILYKNDSLF